MKINIGGYEVEIKAKYQTEQRFNQKDTMAVINQLLCWAGDAAHMYERMKLPALAKSAFTFSNEGYNMLDAKGYFDDVK